MSLLENLAINSGLRGIKVCLHAPSIKHLLFTDDSLIFCKASRSSSQQLLNILKIYTLASGQYINVKKTITVFNQNVRENIKGEIMSRLGTRDTQQYEKY